MLCVCVYVCARLMDGSPLLAGAVRSSDRDNARYKREYARTEMPGETLRSDRLTAAQRASAIKSHTHTLLYGRLGSIIVCSEDENRINRRSSNRFNANLFFFFYNFYSFFFLASAI